MHDESGKTQTGGSNQDSPALPQYLEAVGQSVFDGYPEVSVLVIIPVRDAPADASEVRCLALTRDGQLTLPQTIRTTTELHYAYFTAVREAKTAIAQVGEKLRELTAVLSRDLEVHRAARETTSSDGMHNVRDTAGCDNTSAD